MRSLGVVLVIALLAACSPGRSAGSPPSPSPAAASPPATVVFTPAPPTPSSAASPFVVPTPQGPFLRCQVADLEAELTGIGAAAGNVIGLVELRNSSDRDCDLYGYSGLLLLDDQGRAVLARVMWSPKSFFPPNDVEPSIVALTRGTPPLDSAIQVPGHAYIAISWSDVDVAGIPCVRAARFLLTPPDAYQSIAISAVPRGGTSGQMTVCGTLWVQPVRPAVEGSGVR